MNAGPGGTLNRAKNYTISRSSGESGTTCGQLGSTNVPRGTQGLWFEFAFAAT